MMIEEPNRTETDEILIKQLEDRIRKLEEELKDERHANEVLEYLVENRKLKNKVEYKDGVIYGLKYSIRCNGVSGNDIKD